MKLQIALEFIILFAFLMVIFLFMFALITIQRGNVANQQSFSEVQLLAQNIAQQIDLAISAGNGYNSNISLYSNIAVPIYAVNITSSGVVAVSSKVNTQIITAVAYTDANNILKPSYLSNNTLSIQNYFGELCIDEPCYQIGNMPFHLSLLSTSSSNQGKMGYLIKSTVTNITGLPSQNSLIGFSSTIGNFSKYQFSSNITNSSGISEAFISKSSKTGTAIIKATGFQGSIGIIKNLSMWFPLNLGYGNKTYDLSGYNALGSATNVSWTLPNYLTDFSGNGYLTISSFQIPQTFSLSLWVKPSTYSQMGILGQKGSSSGTLSLETYQTGSKNTYAVSVNGFGTILFGAYAPNAWNFLTLTYNSVTENFSVYENGLLMSSTTEPQSMATSLPFYIGASPSAQTTAQNTMFEGLISNVQVYSSYLSQNTILQMYDLGISAPPVTSNNILWLPLNGDFNNYAESSYSTGSYGYISNIQDSLNTTNENSTSYLAAYFDGSNSEAVLSHPSNQLLQSGYTTPLSISMWFMLGTYQATQPLISTDTNCGYSLSILTQNTISLSDNCGNTFNVNIPFIQKKWYNLIVTVLDNPSGLNPIINYYLNGQLVYSSVTSQWGDTASWPSLVVGSSGSGAYFDGSISNVQIYNTTLSNSSAYAIYSKGEPSIPNTANLISWFPLDGNQSDLSLNQGSTVSSNIQYIPYTFRTTPLSVSINGYGLTFGGNGNIFGSSNTEISANAFSTSAWIYAYPSKKPVELINKYSSNGGASSIYLSLNNMSSNSNSLMFNLSIINSGSLYGLISGAIKPYVWYYVAGTYNGTDITTYIDGTKSGSYPFSGTLSNTITSFNIGGYTNNINGFEGSIADVSLYKTALNGSQLSLLYKLGLPVTSSTSVPLS